MTTKNRSIGSEIGPVSTDLYTVPTQYEANVKSIFLTNGTSSTRTVTLTWYQSSTNVTWPVTTNLEMVANGIIQITDSLYLNKGDKFSASADAIGVNIHFNVEENFIGTRTQ